MSTPGYLTPAEREYDRLEEELANAETDEERKYIRAAMRELVREEQEHDEWERYCNCEKVDPWDGPESKARRIGLLITRQGTPEPGEEGRAISWSNLVQPGDSRASWHYVYTRITWDELVAKYADAFSPIAGFAYLDETGWHEPGKMGWWACSSDTPETLLANKRSFTAWLKETPDDAWLIAVDCHI